MKSASPLLPLTILMLPVFLVGCGKQQGGGDAGLEGLGNFQYTVADGQASLSVVFENLALDTGARIPLRRPAGGYVELGPDFQSGGTLLVISAPLASLFGDNRDLPLAGLPDGRPLPGVRSGALGAVAVDLPAIGRTYLYMGVDAFGVFFPLPLPNLSLVVSSKIRDERGNLLGVIYGIPKGSKGTTSGVLFLFPVESGA